MEIILDKIDSVNAQIKVKLNQADYQPKVEKKLKEYSKTAAIKGFRPGKVPVAMINKIYGKSVKINEINDLAVQSLQTYIQNENLNIFASPLLEPTSAKSIDWDMQKDFEFVYEIGLQPDFKVDASAVPAVKTYEVNMTDGNVDKMIESLRKMYATRTNSESSQKGDYLFGSVEQLEGGFKSFAHLKIEDIPAEVQENFIGKKADDQITFDLRKTLPSNEEISKVLRITEEQAAQLAGDFKLTVKESFQEELAEMNEEFFAKLAGEEISSEEQLRTHLKGLLDRKYALESKSLTVRNLRKALLDSVEIALPDNFLKKWLIHSNERITDENVEGVYAQYRDELKWDLIRTYLADEKDLKEIAPEEFLQRIKDMYFLEFIYSNLFFVNDQMVEMFAQKFLTDEQNRDRQMGIYNVLITEKIWDNMQSELKEEKVTITADEFDNLAID